MTSEGIQFVLGLALASVGVGAWVGPWVGVATLGALLLFDVMVDPWRPRR